MGNRVNLSVKFGRKGLLWAGIVIGGGLVAGGCAVQNTAGHQNTEMAEVKIPDPENFTTKGKPTKTIQTPNGPVQVYDPIQDPEVRAAFGRVYDKNNLIVSTKFLPQTYGYAHKGGDRVYSSDGQILLAARARMVQSLIDTNACPIVIDATCSSKYTHICERQNNHKPPNCKRNIIVRNIELGVKVFPISIRPKEFSAVPSPNLGAAMCKIDSGEEIISTDYKIIGPIAPEPLEKQFKWFFSYQCIN